MKTRSPRASVGVFISCAHEDMPAARSIYQRLWTLGVELQLHVVNFLVGHDLNRAAVDAIDAAAVVIFFASPRSFDNSGRLKREQEFVVSVAREEKPLIVVFEETYSTSTPPPPLPPSLSEVPWIRLSEPDGYAQLAHQLLELNKTASLSLAGKARVDPGRPLRLFISYSHRDESYRDELVRHLSSLEREGIIEIWHDRRFYPGTAVDDEIRNQLDSAHVVLILVTADFIASDYCYSKEMHRALERHEWGYCVVVPIVIRPVDWRHAPFAKLLALPRDGKPVTTWEHQDQAFVDVVAGIRRLVESQNHIDGH
jgi:hypothetical protein